MNANMTLATTREDTPKLWRKFKSRCAEIGTRANRDFISIRIYTKPFPEMFEADEPYERWAAVEVTTHDTIPQGMKPHVIGGGQYAVFTHLGPASTFGNTMQYVFQTWLPNSEYRLDSREHFEIMPENYDLHNENAQEDVWVPIQPASTRV